MKSENIERVRPKLTEDVLQVELGEGRFVLDVGWFPEGDPEGVFHGVVVSWENREEFPDWDNPIERIETPHIDLLLSWVVEQTRKYDK